uniref:Uncharacterized protein n=1 Tax=Cacopsylla melanoneura TaxID=428564 RepID=A0A8D8XTU8_9HEMI
MTLSRNQVVTLKRNMDLEYLKHFDEDVQTKAYELYYELNSLKELNQIEISVTLLNKISEVLDSLNEQIQANNDLRNNSQNLTEMLQKEVQQKTFFEGKYNQEKDNNAIISNQADLDEKKFKGQEAKYKTDIAKFQQNSLKLKIENEEMTKEINEHVNEIENLKKNVKQLEEENKQMKDMEGNHKESRKRVMPLGEELLNASSTSNEVRMEYDHSSNNSEISIITTYPAQNRPQTSIVAPNIPTVTQHDNHITSNPNIAPSINSNSNPNNNTNEIRNLDVRNRLFVLGDSHCRFLQPELKMYAHPECRINSVAMPGRKLQEIVTALKVDRLTPETNICIIAGTNDVFQSNYESIIKSYDLLYKKCKNFKVFVVLIPPRYDVKRINSHIMSLNCKIKHHLSKYPNFTCIDPKNFINDLYLFSNDCIHLNRKGITKLSKSIIGSIYGKIHHNSVMKPRQFGTYTGRSIMHNREVPLRPYHYTGYDKPKMNFTSVHQPKHTYSNQTVPLQHTINKHAHLPPTLMQTPIPPPLSTYPPLRQYPNMQNHSQPIQNYQTNTNFNHRNIRNPPPSYYDILTNRNFQRPLTTLV